MATPLIVADSVHYTYGTDTTAPVHALRGVDLVVEPGEEVAIIGHNGSGKSTLAKCLNGLIIPDRGDVCVAGLNSRVQESRYAIRQMVGMVFQNPENQFVATTVEEEVAFGVENLGVPRDEMVERIDRTLALCRLTDKERNPRLLSAGEKARLALAGVLAMEPRCIVFDEATALLDPVSRKQHRELISRLRDDGVAIVSVTHLADDAAQADRVVALDHGVVALEGTPSEVFSQENVLLQLGLDLPTVAEIASRLRTRGLAVPMGTLSLDGLYRAMLDGGGWNG